MATAQTLEWTGWKHALGTFLFRYRNAVFPTMLLLLFALFPPRLAGADIGTDMKLDLLGVLICVAGQGLRALTIGFARIRHGGLHKKVYADRLITGGLFGVVRNPLYIGNILIALGLFVVHNNPWVYLVGAVLVLLAYQCIALAEEAHLSSTFGEDYFGYCSRVARWVPRIKLLPGALEGMRFNWRRILIKDYSVLQCWVVMATALWVNEAFVNGSIVEFEARLLPALLLAAGIISLAAILRFLKKSGRVIDDHS